MRRLLACLMLISTAALTGCGSATTTCPPRPVVEAGFQERWTRAEKEAALAGLRFGERMGCW